MQRPLAISLSAAITVALLAPTTPAAPPDLKARFLQVCDECCPILREQSRAVEKKDRVFYMDSYAARALMVAYDLTRKEEYLAASQQWADAMLQHQKRMIPPGAYYMLYGRKPGEDTGHWYVADSSSIGLGVLAVSVRTADPARKQQYLDSARSFAGLVIDRFVKPSGGVANGHWPKSSDEWWCCTGIFGSLAFHLYAETRDPSYLRVGLGTIDWLNRQDLLGMKDYAMPIVVMYSLEAYSASLPYLEAGSPRQKLTFQRLAKLHDWIAANTRRRGGVDYVSWAGSKSAGMPFHLYVFARQVPGNDRLVAVADDEVTYLCDLLERSQQAKYRSHFTAFALMSLAEKVSPGSIDRPSR